MLRYPQQFSFSSLTKQGIPELQSGVTKFPFQAVPSQRSGLIRGFSAGNAEPVQEGSHSYSGRTSDKSPNCSLGAQGQPLCQGNLREGREHNVQPQQREGNAQGRFGKMGSCDSNQESPGLVPACWDDGRAKWSRNTCAVTGRALGRRRFSGPSGRTGVYFGSVFSQQAVGADKSQESDRLPLCYAAHLGVLDHKSAER